MSDQTTEILDEIRNGLFEQELQNAHMLGQLAWMLGDFGPSSPLHQDICQLLTQIGSAQLFIETAQEARHELEVSYEVLIARIDDARGRATAGPFDDQPAQDVTEAAEQEQLTDLPDEQVEDSVSQTAPEPEVAADDHDDDTSPAEAEEPAISPEAFAQVQDMLEEMTQQMRPGQPAAEPEAASPATEPEAATVAAEPETIAPTAEPVAAEPVVEQFIAEPEAVQPFIEESMQAAPAVAPPEPTGAIVDTTARLVPHLEMAAAQAEEAVLELELGAPQMIGTPVAEVQAQFVEAYEQTEQISPEEVERLRRQLENFAEASEREGNPERAAQAREQLRKLGDDQG